MPNTQQYVSSLYYAFSSYKVRWIVVHKRLLVMNSTVKREEFGLHPIIHQMAKDGRQVDRVLSHSWMLAVFQVNGGERELEGWYRLIKAKARIVS